MTTTRKRKIRENYQKRTTDTEETEYRKAKLSIIKNDKPKTEIPQKENEKEKGETKTKMRKKNTC